MGFYKKNQKKQEALEKQKIIGLGVFTLGMALLAVFMSCNEPVDMGASVLMVSSGIGLMVSDKVWFL
jgi:hypothetical protein